MDLYRDVFRLGEGVIQREGEAPGAYKTNPIIIGHDGERLHRKIMFEDTFEETLAEFCGYEWAYMGGCSYFGRVNSAERQGKLHALIFDLDGVVDSNLNNLLHAAFSGLGDIYPIPQHVVLSGHGVHLYYVLEEPQILSSHIKTQLKELKYALTRRLWNRYTSTVESVQYQGINQSFRVAGSRTKEGCALPACVSYRLSDHPTTIEELNRFVPEESRVDLSMRFRESPLTLDRARELYPEWYERVIVRGERQPCGRWEAKRDLYDWWLRRMGTSDVTYGHRYFSVMCLAIFAAKCGIFDADAVRADAMALLPHFNAINPDHPFTEDDVDSALDCLDARYVRFPREDMEKISAMPMPANKRNGRRQIVHLAGARAVQEVNDRFNNTNWRDGNGRKPKRDLVRGYAAEHPDASQRQIAAALGVSKTTVNKWLGAGWRDEWAKGQGTNEGEELEGHR